MKPRSSNTALRKTVPAMLTLLATAALASWLAWPVQDPPTDAPCDWAQAIARIAAGEPGAGDLAKRMAMLDWTRSHPATLGMLNHENWHVRATACDILASRSDPAELACLLPRASDVNWNVRAAAYRGLSRLGGMKATPLRGTQLDERERMWLAWLDEQDAAPLRHQLCNIYAGQGYLEYGRPLAQRCLQCHAGSPSVPPAVNERCAGCHQETHAAWSASAHGWSTSSLHLWTLDPATREGKYMDLGQTPGIQCVECHRPQSASRSVDGSTQPGRCNVSFQADSPRDSCQRCHADTYAEWRAWSSQPHARRVDWPPGQIELADTGDTRSCVDCHMPASPPAGGRMHGVSARTSPRFLQDGLGVRVNLRSKADGRFYLYLTLTNLSGHAYPTGSRRSGLRLFITPAFDDATSQPTGAWQEPLATFSPVRPGTLPAATEPSLQPGEERAFTIAAPPGAQALTYRLVHVSDLFDPQSLTTEVLAARVSLTPTGLYVRTGLFVPARRALYVAVPPHNGGDPEIREYRVAD